MGAYGPSKTDRFRSTDDTADRKRIDGRSGNDCDGRSGGTGQCVHGGIEWLDAFAPAVGANAISVMRAAFIVGVLGLAGAVLQGANVAEGIGRKLIVGEILTAQAAALALTLAASLVAVGVFAGSPIATAFTVTGAVVGVGLAMGGDPAWAKYREIVALWGLIPFVGGGIAYATTKLLQSHVRTSFVLPVLAGLVGVLLANIEFSILSPAGEGATVAVVVASALPGPPTTGYVLVTVGLAGTLAAVVYRETCTDPVAAQRRALLVMGGVVAFSAGGSQVGLAIGLLLPLLDSLSMSPTIVLAGGGLGLLLESWTGAPRMIKAISQDYSSLGPRRSIAAFVPSFAIAQTTCCSGSLSPSTRSSSVPSSAAVSPPAMAGSVVGRYSTRYWLGWRRSPSLSPSDTANISC